MLACTCRPDATNIIGAAPGTHYLDISADGNWTVTIEQPRTSSAPAIPQTLTGTSDDAKAVMLTSGAIKFDMSYIGDGNFIDLVYDADGNAEGLLANEIDTYSGSKSISVTTPGIHYLYITGIGSWSITVTHL